MGDGKERSSHLDMSTIDKDGVPVIERMEPLLKKHCPTACDADGDVNGIHLKDSAEAEVGGPIGGSYRHCGEISTDKITETKKEIVKDNEKQPRMTAIL